MPGGLFLFEILGKRKKGKRKIRIKFYCLFSYTLELRISRQNTCNFLMRWWENYQFNELRIEVAISELLK